MSLRGRVLGIAETLLRVPPLFAIDQLVQIGLRYYEDLTGDESSPDLWEKYDNGTDITTTKSVFTSLYSQYMVFYVIRLLMGAIGCISAMGMFVLNTRSLIVAYLYLTSVGLVMTSYITNNRTVETLTSNMEHLNRTMTPLDFISDFNLKEIWIEQGWRYQVLENCIVQLAITLMFVNIHLGPRNQKIQQLLTFTFLIPPCCSVLLVPKALLRFSPYVSIIIPASILCFILVSSFMDISNSLYLGYIQIKTFISNFGVSALVENEWHRLKVPGVLRTFWILRTLLHAWIYIFEENRQHEDTSTFCYDMLKYLLINGCDTITSVLGLTSVVSYICNYIGKLFQCILLTEDDNDKNFGTISAIVFYILALQTGLTSLEPDVRFIRLCRNFCLLFTALLHFIHNMVNPLLMSLSTSHSPSIRRHAHALGVCALLIALSVGLMNLLWPTQKVSTWLLAVTAFSIEVIVKVIVSLAIYCLFLHDARRQTFWEKLDDYIYYIRSVGNTIEFCFGIFLFFNGAWILLFESGSAIRAVMMCIHAYFNIWCDAKAGWSVFMKRRTAVNKIDSLPEANIEQLQNLNDVCAICYQEMQSAKITKCHHFFHGVCLRKWLYVQDRCPLCHKILHLVGSEDRRRTLEEEPDPFLPQLEHNR